MVILKHKYTIILVVHNIKYQYNTKSKKPPKLLSPQIAKSPTITEPKPRCDDTLH